MKMLLKIIINQLENKCPWTIGLYESIIATETVFKTKLFEKNRICIIILDSCLEIGFKEISY